MKDDLGAEQQEILENNLTKLFAENGVQEDQINIKELLPRLKTIFEKSKEQEKKAEDVQKLILPDLREQLGILKALYDSRKEGDLLGLKLNRFPQIQKHLDGLQDGFYLIGADPNAGKSATSHNLCLDVTLSNPDIISMCYSLDDSAEDTSTRMIANIAEVEINSIKNPWRLNTEEKARVANAYKTLNELDGRLFILDQEQVQNFANLTHFIEEAIAKYKKKKLVIFIDAIFNLDVEESSLKQIRELNIDRANRLKSLVKKYRIPLICTVELRKKEQKSGNRPEPLPSINDIMESGKYGFNADLIWLLHSTTEEIEKDETKITLLWSKNKLSGFRGKMELKFKRKQGRIEEIPFYYNDPNVGGIKSV